MKKVCILLIFLSVLVIACKSESSPTEVNEKITPVELTGTRWNVVSFEGNEGTTTDPGTVGIFIEFHKDSTITGGSYPKETNSIARNSFSGFFSVVQDSTLIININFVTEVGEPEGSRFYEFVFEVQGEITYKIEERTLTFLHEEDKTIKLEPEN